MVFQVLIEFQVFSLCWKAGRFQRRVLHFGEIHSRQNVRLLFFQIFIYFGLRCRPSGGQCHQLEDCGVARSILTFLARFGETLASIAPKIHLLGVEFFSIFSSNILLLTERYLVVVILLSFSLLVNDLVSEGIMNLDRSNCLLLGDGN